MCGTDLLPTLLWKGLQLLPKAAGGPSLGFCAWGEDGVWGSEQGCWAKPACATNRES